MNNKLEILITANDTASKVIKGVAGSFDGLADAAKTGSQAMLAAVAGAGAAAVGFGVSSVKAFQEAEVANAALANTLKSTGNVAGQTVDGLNKMATQLQSTTGYSDEFVTEAQNMLLTFTKVGKDVFPDATKATLDMARQFGGSASDNAIRLGKALQDPIAGVSALGRIGVQFSDVQQEQIKNFMEAGDVMSAQKVILGEIATQTKGAADAYGQTFAGQVDILKNTFGDLQEQIGEFLVSYLTPLVTGAMDILNSWGGIDGMMANVRESFAKLEPYIPSIAGAIAAVLTPAIVGLVASVGPVVLAIAGMAAIGAILGPVIQNLVNRIGGWDVVMDVAKNTFDILISAIGQGIEVVKTILNFFKENHVAIAALAGGIVAALIPAMISAAIGLWGMVAGLTATAVAAVAAMLPFLPLIAIGAALGATAYLIIANWDTLKSWFNTAMTAISEWVSQAVSNIKQWFNNAVQFVVAAWQWWYAGVTAIFNMLAGAIQAYINTYVAIIRGIIGAIMWIFQTAMNGVMNIWNGITGFFSGIVGRIGSVLSGVRNALTAPFEAAFNFVKDIPGRMVGAIGNVGQLLRDKLGGFDIPGPLGLVRDVIPGFATGVHNFAGGAALVGERGPEIVTLPKGANVIGNHQLAGLNGGLGGAHIEIHGNVINENAEASNAFWDRINRMAELAGQGLAQ